MRGDGRVFKRGNRWWIAYNIDKKEHRESAGRTRQEAEALLAHRMGHDPAPMAQKTVSDLLDTVVADYRANRAKSLTTLLSHVRAVRTEMGLWPATRVTRDRLVEVRDKWLSAGMAPATINRRLAALARGWKLSDVGPAPRWPYLTERNARTGFFDREEIERLIPFLPAYLRPVTWFAYYTGWRKGEIAGLRWCNVRDRTIRLDDSKSGHGRVLVLEGALWELVSTQVHPVWVFPGANDQLGDIRHPWRTACRKVGLEGKLFHDLRRTAVRNMIRAGVPERVAMEISGHRTRKIFDRYNIVDERDIRDAMRRVMGEAS